MSPAGREPDERANVPGATIAPSATERQARADALRSIAFDASSELELRAAYAATGDPRFLVEAGQADVAAEHWGAAMVTLRSVYPQIEARPYASVPREAWEVAYPLPHAESINLWATHNGLDPMLVAGLSRQESAFDPEARSPADALGVMQLLPKTARLMAKQEHVRYSASELFDADYNIRLGHRLFCRSDEAVRERGGCPGRLQRRGRPREHVDGDALPRHSGVRRLDSVYRDARVRGDHHAQRLYLPPSLRHPRRDCREAGSKTCPKAHHEEEARRQKNIS